MFTIEINASLTSNAVMRVICNLLCSHVSVLSPNTLYPTNDHLRGEWGGGGKNSALMTRLNSNGEGSFSYSTHKYCSLFSFTSDLSCRLRESQLDSQYMEHLWQEQLNYGIFLTWSS